MFNKNYLNIMKMLGGVKKQQQGSHHTTSHSQSHSYHTVRRKATSYDSQDSHGSASSSSSTSSSPAQGDGQAPLPLPNSFSNHSRPGGNGAPIMLSPQGILRKKSVDGQNPSNSNTINGNEVVGTKKKYSFSDPIVTSFTSPEDRPFPGPHSGPVREVEGEGEGEGEGDMDRDLEQQEAKQDEPEDPLGTPLGVATEQSESEEDEDDSDEHDINN